MVASSNSNGLILAVGLSAAAGLLLAAIAEPGTTAVLVRAARRRNVRRFIRQIFLPSWACGTVAELPYVHQASNMSQARVEMGQSVSPELVTGRDCCVWYVNGVLTVRS